MKEVALRPKRRRSIRDANKIKKRFSKYFISPETKIDYKNVPLLQKYVTNRGKILSRRITGISAKQQRDLTQAVKRAKYLALLPVGSAKRRNA